MSDKIIVVDQQVDDKTEVGEGINSVREQIESLEERFGKIEAVLDGMSPEIVSALIDSLSEVSVALNESEISMERSINETLRLDQSSEQALETSLRNLWTVAVSRFKREWPDDVKSGRKILPLILQHMMAGDDFHTATNKVVTMVMSYDEYYTSYPSIILEMTMLARGAEEELPKN